VTGRGLAIAIPGLAPLALPFAADGIQPGETVVLGIRPEHVAEAGTTGDAPAPVLDFAEQLGSQSYLYCTLPGGQKLTVHSQGQRRVTPGERLSVRFPPEHCHLFRGSDEQALERLE
jgi:multiple sugar transport system ATP-binding protein